MPRSERPRFFRWAGRRALPLTLLSASAMVLAIMPSTARADNGGSCVTNCTITISGSLGTLPIIVPPTPTADAHPYDDMDDATATAFGNEEDKAVAAIEALHHLPANPTSRDLLVSTDKPEVRAFLYGLITDAIHRTDHTTDENLVIGWLQHRVQEDDTAADQKSIDQFNSWKNNLCTYTSPAPFTDSSNSYYWGPNNNSDPNYCPTFRQEIMPAPQEPSLQQFEAYGTAVADSGRLNAGLVADLNTTASAAVFAGSAAGSSTVALAGAATAANYLLENGLQPVLRPLTYARSLKAPLPRIKLDLSNRGQYSKPSDPEAPASQPSAVEAGPVDAEAAVEGSEVVEEASLAADTLAEVGGPLGIILLAVFAAVFQGIQVITASKIPGQLQDQLSTDQNQLPDLGTMLLQPGTSNELYKDFVAATPSVPTTYSFGPGVVPNCGLTCDVQSTAVPARANTDPVLVSAQEGYDPSTDEPYNSTRQRAIDFTDSRTDPSLAYQMTVQGGFFDVSPPGDPGDGQASALLHYEDPTQGQMVAQIVYVTAPNDPTLTDLAFMTRPESFDPSGSGDSSDTSCSFDDGCALTQYIEYVNPDNQQPYSLEVADDNPPNTFGVTGGFPTVGQPFTFQQRQAADVPADPDGDAVTYDWRIQDAAGTHTFSNAGTSLTYTPSVPGTASVTVTATDAIGATTTEGTTVDVTPGPGAISITGFTPKGGVITEGTTVTVTGDLLASTFDASPTATIDWGDGSTSTAAIACPPGGGLCRVGELHYPFLATHTYTGTPPDYPPDAIRLDYVPYTITATGSDLGDGSSPTATAQVALKDVAPSFSAFNGPSSVNEGQTVTYTGAIADPGINDPLTLDATWGDGTPDTVLTRAPGQDRSFTITHTYADNLPGNKPEPIAIAVADTELPATVIHPTLSVVNVVPTVTLPSESAGPEGSASTLHLHVADPGVLDNGMVHVAWGDGANSDLAYTMSPTGVDVDASHVYAHHSSGSTPYQTQVTASDKDGGVSIPANIPVYVTDVAPTLAPTTIAAVDEGSSSQLSLTPVDVGGDGGTYSVDWGDGSTPSKGSYVSGASALPLTHTYADNAADGGSWPVAVTLDDGASSSVAHLTALVGNVAPVLSIASLDPGAEGSASVLHLHVADPGALDNGTLSLDWGDGTAKQSLPYTMTPTGAEVDASHVYATAGPAGTPYLATVTATDKDGGVSQAVPTSVTVADVAPTLTPTTIAAADEGSPSTLSVTPLDPGGQPGTVTVDWGDGSAVSAAPYTVGAAAIPLTHTFADNAAGAGWPVTVTLAETGGGSTVAKLTAAVEDVAPTLSSLVDTPSNEGGLATLTGVLQDPGSKDNGTVAISWGDASAMQTVTYAAGATSFIAQHAYADNRPSDAAYTVTATPTDKDGTSGAVQTAAAAVADVAPIVSDAHLTDVLGRDLSAPGAFAVAGLPLNLSATESDPGVHDTYTATVAWGGSAAPATVTGSTISASHVPVAGTDPVLVTATDNDSKSGSLSVPLTTLTAAQALDALLGQLAAQQLTSPSAAVSAALQQLGGQSAYDPLGADAALADGAVSSALTKIGSAVTDLQGSPATAPTAGLLAEIGAAAAITVVPSSGSAGDEVSQGVGVLAQDPVAAITLLQQAVTSVAPSVLDHITLTTGAAGTDGSPVSVHVEGFDAYGNDLGDMTRRATLGITPDGSCSANACTPATGGAHQITATLSTPGGSAASSTAVVGIVPGYQAPAFPSAQLMVGDKMASATWQLLDRGSASTVTFTATAPGQRTHSVYVAGLAGKAVLHGLTDGVRYTFTLTAATRGGSVAIPLGIGMPARVPTIHLHPAKGHVAKGASDRLTGTVTIGGAPFAGRTVLLVQRVKGGSHVLGRTITDAHGRFGFTVHPHARADYAAVTLLGPTSAPAIARTPYAVVKVS